MNTGRLLRQRLAIETGVWATVAMMAVMIGFRLMPDIVRADGWLVMTTVVLVWELQFLWMHRPTPGPEATPTLGVANAITLTRGVLFACVAGFVTVTPVGSLTWGPSILYGVGVTLDAVDGKVARTIGRRTHLGTKLDHAFDTLGLLTAPLVAVLWGRLPVWYLALAVARYIYRLGLWAYRRRGGTVRELPDPTIRRPLAAVQMAFLTVVLAPVVPLSVVTPAAAVVAGLSLAVFCWDYLYVIGVVRPDAE